MGDDTSDPVAVVGGSGTDGRSGGETPSDDGGSCCRGWCCLGGGGEERGVDSDEGERLAKDAVRETLPLLAPPPAPTIEATSSPARKPASCSAEGGLFCFFVVEGEVKK